MRIDRFLHCIRFTRSRSLAQGLVATGHVRIDGRRVHRPSETVREGQILALPLHGKVRVIRVAHLPHRRGPASEARCCYTELGVDECEPRS